MTTVSANTLRNSSYVVSTPVVHLPPLNKVLNGDKSSELLEPVRAGSLTVQIEFCTHDSSIFVVGETFMSSEGQVNHRLHLLRASNDAESGDEGLKLELLGSHNLRDHLTFTEVGGPMKDAEDLMTALEADDDENEDDSSVDVMLRTAESKGATAAGKIDENDASLYSRKLSFAWLPATTKLASVQWGEVRYWNAKTRGNNQGLSLGPQDGHDLRLRTNKVTLVVSSLTNVALPPLKRVSNLQLEASKAPLPSEDDLVVVVCGAAPAKLLRVDGTGNLISTIECQLEDEALRAKVSFTCACICANNVLLGGSDGAIYVVDTESFEFVDRLTIPYPSKHRGKLDFRANTLNKIKAQRLSKKKSTLTGEKVKGQQKADQRRRQKQVSGWSAREGWRVQGRNKSAHRGDGERDFDGERTHRQR